MTDVRAFVAIRLSSDLLRLLSEQMELIKGGLPHGAVRWVRVENIHLTLKFLGEVATDDINTISHSIINVAARHEPFQFEVASFGCFPNLNKPRTLWIGIQESGDSLVNLHTDLEETLDGIGYHRERRAFHPHLTVGRVKRTARGNEAFALSESLNEIKLGSIGTVDVKEIDLMRSELRPTGAVYTRLSTAPMKEEG